jgi:hypothetical protein
MERAEVLHRLPRDFSMVSIYRRVCPDQITYPILKVPVCNKLLGLEIKQKLHIAGSTYRKVSTPTLSTYRIFDQ